MATSNIARRFKAFPNLEEDAINAVNHLCEDQDSNGYKAIVLMSEEQPRWLERNVDVLVQLLQSDEPEEVAVVKIALIQHLEFDFKVTLGIFCDQIEPPDNPMEDEDKTICERLRALVVAFLVHDVRSPLLAQLHGQGRGAAEQEDALIDRYPYQGSIQIFRYGRGEDILLFLPSFNDGQPRRRGNELVHLLLACGASALREDLAPGQNPASLEQYPTSPVKSGSSDVDGGTARYILRTTGNQMLGWMTTGFGRNMGDSPMVVVWPSRGADGGYSSVAPSQCKAPYKVMPTPDPHPPFAAELSLTDTCVTVANPQIAFTQNAPPDGMQNIIWAFSRTPPASDDPGVLISIHHKVGCGVLNLTRIPTIPAEPPAPLPPPPPVHIDHPHPNPEDEDDHDDDDEKAEDDEGESHDEDGASGGSASFVHGALCTVGFLLVLPSGALVARYAKATTSPRAFLLHRLLQFGLAGASIAGGTLAYLFMDNHGSSGGAGLVLLYVVRCAIGSWVHRIPAERRTGAHSALLGGVGGAIVLLAFFETWLGLLSAGRSTLVWSALLFTVPSLYVVGVMAVQRRFGSVKEDAKGEYVALDTRPPSNDELEDDDEKL
ncbi:hypothetical protein EDB87DRAFT_1690378 [Lactarius vividus]|nr:hypothetical protein EDB87DRAFT_1690378 [Lactarius vividus]